jgi:hypothetical protein
LKNTDIRYKKWLDVLIKKAATTTIIIYLQNKHRLNLIHNYALSNSNTKSKNFKIKMLLLEKADINQILSIQNKKKFKKFKISLTTNGLGCRTVRSGRKR